MMAPLLVAFLIGTSAYAADEKTAAPVPQAVAALASLTKHTPVVESGAYGWNTGQYSYDAAGATSSPSVPRRIRMTSTAG
jgi:hypothetical protein